jgi:lipopolysaccharide export system protein LptA
MGCDIARMGEDEGTIEILDKMRPDYIEHVENIITTKQLTYETEENIVNANNRYKCKKIGIVTGS